MEPMLENKLTAAREKVKQRLPEPESVTEEAARKIIRRYVAAIEGNFVSWMGATVIAACSIQGRFAAEENLYVEMKDDHAGMLRAFAKSVNAEPTKEDYQYVASVVAKMRELVAELLGVKNLTLMTTLESTSAVFIPFLAELARKLGSTNLVYTDVHGEADVKHADQFLWALESEMQHHEQAENVIDETVAVTLDFLRKVLEVEK